MTALSQARRIVAIGCSGAGKTTLSARLAARRALPHLQRDLLGPEGSDEFRANVSHEVAANAWIFDGAPYRVEETVYPRAALIVALDHPRRVVMRRSFTRSLRGGSPWYVVAWSWKVWPERRCEIGEPERRGLPVLRLRSPRAARRALEGL
jgi:adenylate kinase family enzyme